MIPPESWRDWVRLAFWEFWMGMLVCGTFGFGAASCNVHPCTPFASARTDRSQYRRIPMVGRAPKKGEISGRIVRPRADELSGPARLHGRQPALR